MLLYLGLKKSLLPPRLELMAQGIVQCTNDQSQVWYHSAIQAPDVGYIWSFLLYGPISGLFSSIARNKI